MIPRRIALRGFLCYKDEQVIDLGDRDLWVFSGRNGSGKSAVFDAMTFALFGAHRGGKQNAASLINADASELAVAFEFDLGSHRYRIKRGLRRSGRAERQVHRFEPGENGDPDRWPAVPETESDAGLKRWVQEHVGLTFETFTASVLLMQGRAESLLGAQPRERFEILAGIVDLASYQRLYKRADERRQETKALAESLRQRLRGLPEIGPEAVADAERRLAEADAARADAEAEWKRLVDVEAVAKFWLGLDARRREACRRREHAERLMAESSSIARDWARLRELDAALPMVRDAIAGRRKRERAVVESRRLREESAGLGLKIEGVTTAAEENRRQLETIVAEIGRDEERRREARERLAGLALPIHRATKAREQATEIARLGTLLASYPDGLEGEVASLEEAHRVRAEWKAALPFLKALARGREGLAEARRRLDSAIGAIEAGAAETRRVEAELASRREEESAARRAEREARDRLTEAATHLRSASDRLQRFEGLRDASACDRCGQPLSPKHREAEAARLRDDRDLASRRFEEAEAAQHAAKGRLDDSEARRTECDGQLQRARAADSEASRDRAQAGRDVESHTRSCEEAYEHLTEPFRSRVAAEAPGDWSVTKFPAPDDLAEGRRLGAEVAGIRGRLEEARGRLAAMREDRARLDRAREALTAIGLEPGDEAAEAEQVTLSAEVGSLDRCLKGHAEQKKRAERERAELEESLKEWQGRRAEADSRLAAETSRIEALCEESVRALAAASEDWRDALDVANEDDFNAWDAERRALRDGGIEARAEELPRAQLLHAQARSEVDDLDRQIAAIPGESRRDPKEVAPRSARAREDLELAEEGRRARQGGLDALRRDREQRRAMEAQALDAERDLVVAETLARLLGRDGLQRERLREAERGILDCANPILREISGGELELRLLEGDDDPDHALPLEALVRTHGRTCAHEVAYLSGSQKFRVAVSLALGIGQYARGLHRPIQSVIIDEGFGCLDRQGRDEMIAELNALKGRLDRIVLVSHQEEFAEAFDDGYRFEVVEGSTVARPFHR